MIVELITAGMCGAAAVADFTGAEFVRRNAAELDLDPKWTIPLGVLKALGALGLLVGLVVPSIGFATAVGLTLFFVGAVAIHVRQRVFHNIAAPAVFLVMAVLSLW